MDKAGKILRSKKYNGFLLSLLFALTPLPSNIYFLIIGMMKTRYFSVFFGFGLGRFINNWIMISITPALFESIAEVLTGRLSAVILVDSLGVIMMLAFAFIDWEKLIEERHLVFIKPAFLGGSKKS